MSHQNFSSTTYDFVKILFDKEKLLLLHYHSVWKINLKIQKWYKYEISIKRIFKPNKE